jgi:transcriptional regulator of aromatic amino acid metabolism
MDTWNCSLYDLVLRIDIMTVDDVVGVLEDVVRQGRFDATPESTLKLKEQALLANIHAKIVSIAPKATVSIKDGVVTLNDLDGGLRNNKDLRRQTADRLIRTYNLKDVVFGEPVKAKKDHINPFYNLD